MGIPWENFLDRNSQILISDFHTIMKGAIIMGFIYCFTNKVNNKQYIGQTINSTNERYNNHKSNYQNENSKEYNSLLHKAFRKYGFENFKYEIIAKDIDDIDILNLLEIYYIEKYDTLMPKGYNIEKGGKNCSKPKSQEQKEKLTWGQAKLTKEEIVELRIAYKEGKSPSQIYKEKYQNKLQYASFMNIWSGRRYQNIMPECLENGRHTKMTWDKVKAIRKLYEEEKISYEKLAKRFDCSKATIADIIKERTWKSEKEPVSTIP